MKKLAALAIEARINKESKEIQVHLAAFDKMVKYANSLRPIYGSKKVNSVIDVNYHNFTL